MIKKRLFSSFGLLISLLLLQTCILKPEFSEVPEIAFDKIERVFINSDGVKIDSIVLSVKFKDGDGDLGLNSEDTISPYQEKKANGTANEFFYNYYVTMERKTATGYVPIVFTGPNLDGRFPLLNIENKKTPLEGTLNRGFSIFYSSYPVINIPKNSYVRFKIQIADRALHKSNQITTDSLLVNTN